MRSLAISVLFMALLGSSILIAQEKMQDLLYLKDGSIIRGTIIEKVENEFIKIKTLDGNEIIYKMTEIDKIMQIPILKKAGKSPLLSCGLSILFPGLGQHYNGDYLKGFIQEGIFITGAGLVLHGFYNDYPEYEPDASVYIGCVAAMVAQFWSIIDAPIRSNQINKQNRPSYGHLIEYQLKDHVFGIDFQITKNQIASKICLHF